jgi:PAS domain S-box-containing protein
VLWCKYKLFARQAMQRSLPFEVKDIAYWQQNLFTNIIVYSLPLSLLAVIPSIIITYEQGLILVPAMDLAAIVSIATVSLNKSINLAFRKAFVASVLYVVAAVLMLTLGSFGIGSIYFLALSVFISLLYSKKQAYRSLIVNFFIYLSFTAVIAFKPFQTPLTHNYSLPIWIAYSLNFLFLNTAVVVQICHIINGMESTIIKELSLLKQIKAQVAENEQQNQILKESEGHYRSLFFFNPSPMWIFDIDTLRFLQVNDAAVQGYGYSQEEFLSMTIKDIRLKDSVNDLLDTLEVTLATNSTSQQVCQHCRKDGQLFYAEVRCSTIAFKGKEARLVIARNITAQIEHTHAIEKQNEKLREIAFIQSHIVRAPLARILGLTDLLIQSTSKGLPDKDLLNYLETSAKELDEVVKTIVHHSEETFPVSTANIGFEQLSKKNNY